MIGVVTINVCISDTEAFVSVRGISKHKHWGYNQQVPTSGKIYIRYFQMLYILIRNRLWSSSDVNSDTDPTSFMLLSGQHLTCFRNV